MNLRLARLTVLICAMVRVGGSGGAVEKLATGQTSAGIATDSTCVFWSSRGTAANDFQDGGVPKLAK
jgi:hypothetical protein